MVEYLKLIELCIQIHNMSDMWSQGADFSVET